MDSPSLESYLQHVILSQYGDVIAYPIVWKDHGKVDLDAWAHYFDDAKGREHALLYEDFPDGSFLSDGLSHEVVNIGDETSLHVSLSNDVQIDNIVGYFTLYRENQ
ncbi:MAG: hypothetical protein ABIP74_03065 [Candidatus Saccharimonas sp.]